MCAMELNVIHLVYKMFAGQRSLEGTATQHGGLRFKERPHVETKFFSNSCESKLAGRFCK